MTGATVPSKLIRSGTSAAEYLESLLAVPQKDYSLSARVPWFKLPIRLRSFVLAPIQSNTLSCTALPGTAI